MGEVRKRKFRVPRFVAHNNGYENNNASCQSAYPAQTQADMYNGDFTHSNSGSVLGSSSRSSPVPRSISIVAYAWSWSWSYRVWTSSRIESESEAESESGATEGSESGATEGPTARSKSRPRTATR